MGRKPRRPKTTDAETAARLFLALKRIASYDDPAKIRRTSEKKYALFPAETIEYA